MATKKPPTRKQLAARKKFVKMVRARARAAKAAKRAATKRPVRRVTARSTRKPGASRKRTANRSAKNPVVVVRNGKRKGNGIFRTAARQAISRRLTQPIRFGRKRRKRRNSETPPAIAQLHEDFLGVPVKSTSEVAAPDGTPIDVMVCGPLTQIVSEIETFDFDSRDGAKLGADSKEKLHVLGDIHVESNADFGKLLEISYVAAKPHLENPRRRRNGWHRRKRNGRVEWFHKFGEGGTALPRLKTDREGMFHICGGGYTIEPEGITG